MRISSISLAALATASLVVAAPTSSLGAEVPVVAGEVARTTSGPIEAQSATGGEPLGTMSIGWKGATFKVPTGCTLGHSIRGSGRTITKQWASVTCASPCSRVHLTEAAVLQPAHRLAVPRHEQQEVLYTPWRDEAQLLRVATAKLVWQAPCRREVRPSLCSVLRERPVPGPTVPLDYEVTS